MFSLIFQLFQLFPERGSGQSLFNFGSCPITPVGPLAVSQRLLPDNRFREILIYDFLRDAVGSNYLLLIKHGGAAFFMLVCHFDISLFCYSTIIMLYHRVKCKPSFPAANRTRATSVKNIHTF